MFSSQQSQVSSAANYIEDVFSTYLYAGNSSTQTITNGIDLSTKGGLVWLKSRTGAYNHNLMDTARGMGSLLESNTTAAQQTGGYTTATTTGFSINVGYAGLNQTGSNYASWTFRKQPKFFDVVTYTGNGTAGRTVAHSLGSTPGCIIVKDYANAGNNWKVYHRSLGGTKFINLSATTAAGTDIAYWNNTDPTSTVFTVGDDSSVNGSGRSYVAYIFAHDAGGFGLAGTDNVISCGSFTTDASGNATVSLGYEPQWVLWKAYGGTTGTSDWDLFDNMRGYCVPGASNDKRLQPNSSGAESTVNIGGPNATGFTVENQNATSNYIYIAIRRGPMKVPTDATKVFSPVQSSASVGTAVTTGFPIDLQIGKYKSGADNNYDFDRLRGVNTTTGAASPALVTNTTAAESSANQTNGWNNTGFSISANFENTPYIYWNFRRAPNFFDEVCWTQSGGTGVVTHNLGVTPELIITKNRANVTNWDTWTTSIGANILQLNTTSAVIANTKIYNVTSTTFTADITNGTNVAYLFASCPGVSKVGTYTGNGSTQTIDCGFPAGARFVLIKRTDSTGDWYVYDTARGMTTLTDPYLLMNSNSAETATLGSVTTVSTGFKVDASILAAVNTNTATYLYLAIA